MYFIFVKTACKMRVVWPEAYGWITTALAKGQVFGDGGCGPMDGDTGFDAREIVLDARLAREFVDHLARFEPLILERIETSTGENQILPELLEAVREAFRDGHPALTIAAANAARFLACQAPRTLGSMPSSVSSLADEILDLMDHEAAEVRSAALEALAEFGSDAPAGTLEKILNALRDDCDSVRVRALRALQSLGTDLASASVEALCEALTDPVQLVRLEVCRTLAWLEVEAVPALSELIDVAISDEDGEVRQAAARALATIDPDGSRVTEAVRDQETLQRLVNQLREIGSAGRPIRRALQTPRYLKKSYRTLEDIAEEGDVSVSTLRRKCAKNKIILSKEAGFYRLSQAELENILR